MTPRSCPICNHPGLRRLLADIPVSAKVNGGTRTVSGLIAFTCDFAGHIFFVRIADLVAADEARKAGDGRPGPQL